jgi:hypothetical protein
MCDADIKEYTYCNECYKSKEEHENAVIEEDEEDEEDEDNNLYIEEQTVTYYLEKKLHYNELKENMDKLKSSINTEVINEFDKIEINDNILSAYSGVFDAMVTVLNKIEKGTYKKEQLILVARYTLGYQIEYCLRTTDICNVDCER